MERYSFGSNGARAGWDFSARPRGNPIGNWYCAELINQEVGRVIVADVHEAGRKSDAVAAFLGRKAVEQSLRGRQHDRAVAAGFAGWARGPELRTFLVEREAKRLGCLIDRNGRFESREVNERHGILLSRNNCRKL